MGGGTCALMLGSSLDPEKFEVAIYEKNTAPARKFLVAGDGGLNLTHSEDPAIFITRYTPCSFLSNAFTYFSNLDLRHWLASAGIDTYVGSSGRVFPEKGIKPVTALNSLLSLLRNNGAKVYTNYEWMGFNQDKNLVFDNQGQLRKISSDVVIFCLGGASWPVTGSSGSWAKYFLQQNIRVNPFEASNCSFKIRWPAALLEKIEGAVLKNISISVKTNTHYGEVVITRQGIEGSGIYPLSPWIRQQLNESDYAGISIDLKPSLTKRAIVERLLTKKRNASFTEHLRTQLNFRDVHIHLLKHFISKEEFLSEEKVAGHVKALKLRITGTGPVEDAISTVGGIAINEIDAAFQLKKMPGVYVVGEMLDYDAPTGGYLLQSCFSMAKFVASHLNSLQQ